MVCWIAVDFSVQKQLPECHVRCLPIWFGAVGRPSPPGTMFGTLRRAGIEMVSWELEVAGTNTYQRMRALDRWRTSVAGREIYKYF